MNKVTVITGWSPKGWIQYGARFLDTFRQHWSRDVELVVYTEEPQHLGFAVNRLIWDIPGCKEFIERYRHSPSACGKVPEKCWRAREVENGYSFRTDAWKFCRQGFIPYHAALNTDSNYLCWLDGDVVTNKDVPLGFLESLMPKDKDVAYLGRDGAHSEIGFQLYRLPEALPLLKEFSRMYDSSEMFQLPQWHSAFVWDYSRIKTNVRAHSLTKGSGHVWHSSPLRRYTDHLKGDRKSMKASPERRAS